MGLAFFKPGNVFVASLWVTRMRFSSSSVKWVQSAKWEEDTSILASLCCELSREDLRNSQETITWWEIKCWKIITIRLGLILIYYFLWQDMHISSCRRIIVFFNSEAKIYLNILSLFWVSFSCLWQLSFIVLQYNKHYQNISKICQLIYSLCI